MKANTNTKTRITKRNIAEAVAKQTGLDAQQSLQAVHAIAEFVSDSLIAGHYVGMKGLGTFSVVERKPHMGNNFHTAKPIAIPSRKAVKFTPGVFIRENLNN